MSDHVAACAITAPSTSATPPQNGPAAGTGAPRWYDMGACGATVEHWIFIGIDGCGAPLLRQWTLIGTPGNLPNMDRIKNEGMWTFNARSDPYDTETTPNHITMLTGRSVYQPVGWPATTHHGWQFTNYAIPFGVWGHLVPQGDAYAFSGGTRFDPGAGRPDYTAAQQPIRHADGVDLGLNLMGMPPIDGATIMGVSLC